MPKTQTKMKTRAEVEAELDRTKAERATVKTQSAGLMLTAREFALEWVLGLPGHWDET